MAAGTTIGATVYVRCAYRFCPCQLRRTSFNQKIADVVRTKIFLSHALDHPVLHINRVKSHITFLLPRGQLPGHSSIGGFCFVRHADNDYCLMLNTSEKVLRPRLQPQAIFCRWRVFLTIVCAGFCRTFLCPWQRHLIGIPSKPGISIRRTHNARTPCPRDRAWCKTCYDNRHRVSPPRRREFPNLQTAQYSALTRR